MNTVGLGSIFELSLRILLLLNELQTDSLDEHQIGAIDFIAIYAADFGLLDENLHGYNNYRFSEYPARQLLISSALKELILNETIKLYPTSTGYRYSITEAGKSVCQKLVDNYADEYRIAVQAVIKKFNNANVELMLREINRITIHSLQEIGHE